MCQIPPPIVCGFGKCAFPLQQQRQVERCINVVGRNQQGLAQALDGGFGAPLTIWQVGELYRASANAASARVAARKAASFNQ